MKVCTPRTMGFAGLVAAMVLTGCSHAPRTAMTVPDVSVAAVDCHRVAPKSLSMGAGDSIGQKLFAGDAVTATADIRE